MKIVGPLERPVLNKWCTHPKGTIPRPSLKSALIVTTTGRADKLAEGAVGYLESAGSDVQHSAQAVSFASDPRSNGNGWSITPDNFKKSMAIFAVRKSVKKTWLNEHDQFTVPKAVL